MAPAFVVDKTECCRALFLHIEIDFKCKIGESEATHARKQRVLLCPTNVKRHLTKNNDWCGKSYDGKRDCAVTDKETERMLGSKLNAKSDVGRSEAPLGRIYEFLCSELCVWYGWDIRLSNELRAFLFLV